jgi:hypothetical protein
MQVYVVTAGWDYEGTDVCCLYMHKADADAHADRLVKKESYDWSEVFLQTVHQGPLVAA